MLNQIRHAYNVMLKNHVLYVITILTLVRKNHPGNSTKIQTTCGDPCFNGIDMTAFIWIRYQAEIYIRSFSTGLAQDVYRLRSDVTCC